MIKNKFLKYTIILTGIFMIINLVLIYNFYKLMCML